VKSSDGIILDGTVHRSSPVRSIELRSIELFCKWQSKKVGIKIIYYFINNLDIIMKLKKFYFVFYQRRQLYLSVTN